MAEAATKRTDSREQVLAWMTRGREWLGALPEGRRNSLLVSVLLLVGTGASTAWYLGLPDWKVLFSGLEARDVQTVTRELAAAGVTFRMTADGSGVEVPAEALDKARMEVAGKGMPQTGRLGFELFDKPNWAGSEFDERVNYQRALEGELEHTISTLNAVKTARVHLVLPTASMFAEERKVAKASVVLKLKEGEIGRQQVDAIRHLVAGSVENLAPENVTLVDADGRADMNSHTQIADETAVEEGLRSKLVALLEPLVGANNVRTVVNASYDPGREEKTSGPSGASGVNDGRGLLAKRATQMTREGRLPPLLGENKQDALTMLSARGTEDAKLSQEGIEGSEASRREVHGRDAVGWLRHLSVAVLVNDRRVLQGSGTAGKVSWEPRTAEEMHRLEGLTRAAIGFDAARGDQLTVENVSFLSNFAETAPASRGTAFEAAAFLVASHPGPVRAVLAAVLGVLALLMVLRRLASRGGRLLKQTANSPIAASSDRTSRKPTGAEADARETAASRLQATMPGDVLTETLRRHPEESARLLDRWIHAQQEGS